MSDTEDKARRVRDGVERQWREQGVDPTRARERAEKAAEKYDRSRREQR